ncbi:pyridoxamine 5'-phosphate oxidase family protein [Deinococcus sonorensis]|uniref:Pyridoxamine 5'-phosphate oxidase family protein n=2 Tax=Deinococcus sonorensis TaxID=309891 RepID=A0AAU7U9W1_9DEIO
MSELTREENIQHIAAIIKDIKFAMLTTVADDSGLRARPMTTQQAEFDGDIWFIGGRDTETVSDIRSRPQVNVSYSDAKNNYVSVSGRGQLIEDRAKLEELWTDFYKAYFPEGIDDPNIQLIKVEADGAEYWESEGRVRTMYKMARSAVTGQPAGHMGTNETVKL